jgi:ParB-like chromosome segregation protein Spo0J
MKRYVLIAGIARLTAAKLLNLQQVPCVILDLNHDEFIKENTKIVERQ